MLPNFPKFNIPQIEFSKCQTPIYRHCGEDNCFKFCNATLESFNDHISQDRHRH